MKTLKSIIAVISAIGLSTGAASAEEILGTWIERVQVAYENAYDGECDPAYDTLQQSLDDPEFTERLKPLGRAMVHRAIIMCAREEAEAERGRQAFEDWRALGLEDQLQWSYRWQVYQEGRWAAPLKAIDTLEAWLMSGEDNRDGLKVRSIISTRRAIAEHLDGEDEARATLRLFDLLEAQNYVYVEPAYDRSYDYLVQARAYATLGDAAAAQKMAQNITDPDTLIEIHTLNADEELRRDNFSLEPSDLIKLFEDNRERAGAKLEANPGVLALHVEYAKTLRTLGDEAGAIAVLDKAIARLGETPSAFEDEDEHTNWVYNEKAYAEFAIGKIDRGVNTFRKGITAGENGNQNVSQIINLAVSLNYTGRFEEAIAVLSAMGEASEFGDMFDQSVRACAAHSLDDAETASRHLAYVVENKDDNIGALMQTYICMGMEDEAAALLVERLEDPDKAPRALQSLHRRLPDPTPHPYHQTLMDRLARVRARPDVQAAAAKVGTIIDLPVYNIYWGDT